MPTSLFHGPMARFAGVPAGPAEGAHATGFSAGHLGEVGIRFSTAARVAGLTPNQPGDKPTTTRRCLRTVDSGLALCCALPTNADVRLGTVVQVTGVVTGHRIQGANNVTEISVESIKPIA